MRSCSSPVLVQETCGVKKLNRRPMAGPVNGLAVGPSAGVTGSDRRSPPPTTGTWACSGSMCGCSLSRGVPRFRQLLPARREREFRGSVGTGVTNACSRAPTVRVGCLFGRAGSSWMTSPCSVVAGLSLTGAGASPSEHRGDGRCRDIDPELQELAPDPEVAPSGILPSQTKDQLLDRGIDGRATRPAGPASPTDRELSVPPDERVSADQEALPPVRREESGRRGEERPISGGEPGSHPSSPEDLQLMAEHDRLQIPLPEAAPNQQAKQTAEEPIPQSQEHGPSLDWWRPAGEWRGQSADRVSLPHRHGDAGTGQRPGT